MAMTLQTTSHQSLTSTKAVGRFVKYTFFKVDSAWRHLAPGESASTRKGFLKRIREYEDGLALRTYSLVGTRANADFMLWAITESLETLQGFQSELLKTGLGKYLSTPYSYLAMFKPSEYFGKATEQRTVGSKYLFVYPMTKKREWYSLPFEERRRMMKAHVQIGHRYSSVTIHTAYSFGLDDYEFVLSFETDHPEDFLNLVVELRSSEASRYTAVETPLFTCIATSPEKMLDLLGA